MSGKDDAIEEGHARVELFGVEEVEEISDGVEVGGFAVWHGDVHLLHDIGQDIDQVSLTIPCVLKQLHDQPAMSDSDEEWRGNKEGVESRVQQRRKSRRKRWAHAHHRTVWPSVERRRDRRCRGCEHGHC